MIKCIEFYKNIAKKDIIFISQLDVVSTFFRLFFKM